MKTEIVGEITQEQKIDWSKSMIVESSLEIVLTNGEHNCSDFTGTVILKKPEGDFEEGEFSETWVKKCFKPITHPITIKFSNE